MSLTFQLTVFSDPQGEAAARVYVVAVPDRAATADELAGYRLSGQIIGPTCRYSSTLQTKIPFQHRGLTPCGDRTALLAEALVPDPCYWSTELPFLYRAVGQIIGTDAGPTPFEQTFGIRSVGVLRNRITFNDRIWVPRIVLFADVAATAPLAEWREFDATPFTLEPSSALLSSADEVGSRIFVRISSDGNRGLADLRRLSCHPSVVAAVVDLPMPLDAALRSCAPNVVLGRWYEIDSEVVGMGEQHFSIAPVSDDGSLILNGSERSLRTRPTIACSPFPAPTSIKEARQACDLMQRNLAGIFDFAGYMV